MAARAPAVGAAAGLAPGAARLALAGLVVLAAFLRLQGLGAEPLWLDEAFSWRWAHLPLAELWGPAARTETNPPLWFTIERLAVLLMGEEEAALRLPAALLGIASVPLAFLAGRALAGAGAGLAAALLVATDPLLVAYAQEARGYALLVAGSLLVLWGTLELAAAPAAAASGPGARLDPIVHAAEARPAGPAPGTEARLASSRAGGPGPRGRLAPGTEARLALPDGRRAWPGPAPRADPRLAAAGYALGAALAVYAHNTGLLVPALANLAVLGLWLRRRGGARPRLRPWLVANLPPVLLALWWLPILLEQAGGAANVGWIAQPGPRWALVSWAQLFGPHFLALPPLPAALVGLPVPLLAGLAAARLGERALAPLLLAVGGPLLVLLLGLLARPLWLERVLLPFLAAALVLAGAGLAGGLGRRLRALLLALVLLPRLADLAAWHLQPQKLAWPEAAAVLAAGLRGDDAILLVPHYYHWPWAYYATRAGLPERALGVVVGPPPPPGSPRIEPVDRGLRLVVPEDLEAALDGHARAWLLAYKRRGGDPGGLLGRLAATGRLEPRLRLEGAWDRGELELWLWTRGEAGPARSGIARPEPGA